MTTLMTRDYVVSDKRTYTPLASGLGTYYASLIGSLCSDPTPGDAGILQKRAGRLSKLRVYVLTGGDPNRDDPSITLMKQEPSQVWAATALSKTITAGTFGLFENNTDSVTFAAGDSLCWRIQSNASANNVFGLRFIAVMVAAT